MLGTLLGMLETFQKVSEQGGFTGPAELTAGVFTALITSVLGLTVAVPMYLFYLYFLGRAKRLVHRIERAGIEMVHLIADAREEEEFAPFRGEVTAGRKPAKPKRIPPSETRNVLAGAPGTAACGAGAEYFRAVVAVVSAGSLVAAAIRRGGGIAAVALPA